MPTRSDSQTRRAARDRRRVAIVLAAALLAAGCGPKRLAVIAPLPDVERSARALEQETGLAEPSRIDFSWQLNEAGSRLSGRGVARIEPPYRARLDLFLENLEAVVSAALVDGELRMPAGSREDILPPVELMWGTLGVFRPVSEARLLGGDRLEGGRERLRYQESGGRELHYEVSGGTLRSVELLEGESLVQWVRVAGTDGVGYPEEATYRNLTAFRELKITRNAVRQVEAFDPEIWDPRR